MVFVTRGLTVTDVDQPTEKSLVGIKGWLLLYVLVAILGILLVVTTARSLTDPGALYYFSTDVPLAIATVIGLYMIFYVRKPITRTYHIWLSFIWSGEFLIYYIVIGLAPLLDVLVALVVIVPLLLIWPIYWIRSKRVKATYCQAINRAHNS